MHEADKEFIDPEDGPNRFEDEENEYVNNHFAEMEEPPEEDSRNDETKQLRRKWLTGKICSEDFQKAFESFKDFRVIKYSRFFQSLFYFLGYEREAICEESTNKLWWKKAKNLINEDVFTKIQEYTPIGPKDSEYKKYQLINFIEKNISEISSEEIEQYSWHLSKFYKWMTFMIETRKEDIQTRRDNK